MLRKFTAVAGMVGVLGFGGVGVAQAVPAETSTFSPTVVAQSESQDPGDNDSGGDSTGLWGLAGLAGLLGLVGLAKRGQRPRP